jgi:hypothetical protein
MPRFPRRLIPLAALALTACGSTAPPVLTVPAASTPSPSVSPSASPSPTPAAITYPATGGARYSTARAASGTAGRSGQLLRYRVQVERDIHGVDADDFAAFVDATLADPRGWTAGGAWRLHRVGPGEHADFTIYLVTPGTRDTLCYGTDGYTSCRYGAGVVLNVARWVKGVPRYGAPLEAYRQYMVNHEVGHRLGSGHELCPGPGKPAPVMQQQTLGLHGCVANAWPYLDGKRYAGYTGAYNDEAPPRDAGSN